MLAAQNNLYSFTPHNEKVKTPKKKKSTKSSIRENEKEPFKNVDDLKAINQYFIRMGEYRNYMLFTLGCNLSLRGSDLVKLTWGDIFTTDFRYCSEISLIEQKTKKYKLMDLNDTCKAAIEFYLKKEWLKKEDLNLDEVLFPSRKQKTGLNGERFKVSITRTQLGRIVQSAAKEIGLDSEKYGSHSLRKTFGYTYFKETSDIITLQKLFNHDSALDTLRYIGIQKEQILDCYTTVGKSLKEMVEL